MCKPTASLRQALRKLGGTSSAVAYAVTGAKENRMQGYALTFLGCAVCSLILFVYDVTPNVLKLGKIAVAVFGALFIGAEILALIG